MTAESKAEGWRMLWGEHGVEGSLTESLEEDEEQQPMLLHAPESWHLRDPPPWFIARPTPAKSSRIH